MGEDEELGVRAESVDDALSSMVDERWRLILPAVRAELEEREKSVQRPSPDEIIAKLRENGLYDPEG